MYERRCHKDASILGRTQNRCNAKDGREKADSWKFIWWADTSIIWHHDDVDLYGWLTVPWIWNRRRRIQ